MHEWDRSEDGGLPAPWAWFNAQTTLYEDYEMAGLQRRFRVQAPTPIIFSCVNENMIVALECRYYLHDYNSDLWEFEGTYAGPEDFIENAGNKIHEIKEIHDDEIGDVEEEEYDVNDIIIPWVMEGEVQDTCRRSAFWRAARRRQRRGLQLHRAREC